jgi:predicted deacylase
MRTVRRVPLTTLTSGMELALCIHKIQGTLGDGPTLGISAAIHGDEPGGTHMVMEIARRYGGGNFRGRLILLPVANPLAFEAYSRNTPLDAQNMNRLFPGNAGGRVTEQLVALITAEFLNTIDVYIDIHTAAQPTVDYIYILNAEDLSRSFGSRVLYRSEAGRAGPVYEGNSTSVTRARGVPSVTVELGGGMIDQTPYIARGVAGVENIMRTLGMVDGEPLPPPAQIVVHAITMVRLKAGGFLYTEAPPLGDEIAGGAVLGRVVSPHTFDELEVIRSPVDQGIMILSHLTTGLVQPGEDGYMVGDLTGCERFGGV